MKVREGFLQEMMSETTLKEQRTDKEAGTGAWEEWKGMVLRHRNSLSKGMKV